MIPSSDQELPIGGAPAVPSPAIPPILGARDAARSVADLNKAKRRALLTRPTYVFRSGSIRRSGPAGGRNTACACGSGKKRKYCCDAPAKPHVPAERRPRGSQEPNLEGQE